MPTYMPVAKIADIPAGRVKVVEAAGQRIAVCHLDDRWPDTGRGTASASGGHWYAIEDRCSHDDGPLGEGTLTGVHLECPRHGARFDVTTGRPITLPAVVPVRQFPVKIEGDTVLVQV